MTRPPVRPRPKARMAVDVDNVYGKLGVSPLAATDEIKKLLSDRRGQAMAERRAQGAQGSGAVETIIIELQEIERQIGTPAARDAYDARHPQNKLLAVQPTPRDRLLEPARLAGLVTGWLASELGPDMFLLHPDAYWLWLPGGLDPELAMQLARFEERDALAIDELNRPSEQGTNNG